MQNDSESVAEARKRLDKLEKRLGKIPAVHQILSERPDLFIPNFDCSASIFNGEKVLKHKTKHLIALAAAAAYGSPHCMRAQMDDAAMFGATEDEILETLQIAAYMGLTKCQSQAFRVFAEKYGKKIE